ncbi:MAG: ABC transporter substrate-binding protein, partial [Gemmatimonadaceae bacterium]
NGRYGGTLLTTYLDPPHMDFNRTLSCTINTTLDYTKNKLTRMKLGALAHPLNIDIEPDLAEKWEVNAEATEFTFHLRRGVKFHNVAPVNGRELTSADVKATFERYKAGGTQQDVFAEVASFETPDDYTFKVKLTQPLVDFPRNIAAWSHVDAKEIVADPKFLAEHAIGTGPFLQQEWVRKERTTFVKNPDYFEKGLPFLDRVVATVQSDTATLRAGFRTNNFYTVGALDNEEGTQILREVPDAVQMVYERGQGSNSNVFRFQMKNPVIADIRVRRAISMGIDRAGYSAAQGQENDGFSTPSIAWQFIFDKRPTLASEGQWMQRNVAEAGKLLSAAGYSTQSPLTFEMTGWYISNSYRFLDIQLPAMNEVPGLAVKYRQVDNPTAVLLLNDRNFEWATGMTFGPPSYSVDQSVYPFFHSKGGVNFGNLNAPDLDKLLADQRREQNNEARKEIWKKIWNWQLDQIYDVYMPENPRPRILWHNWMLGFRPHGIGTYGCYGNGQARSVWLDEGAPAVAVLPQAVEDATV